jgi:hypothetical protein
MKHIWIILFHSAQIETDFWNVQEEIIEHFVNIKVPILKC